MNRWLSLILSMICITELMAGAMPAIVPPQPTPQPGLTGGEDVDLPRDELSPAQEQAMWAEIQRNIALLQARGTLAAPDASQAVIYNFPLRLASGLPAYAGFRVSAFVDHNPASGQVLDYNGGARTYDGHHGITYRQMMHVGGWELMFGPPSQQGFLPVLFHALFK